MIKLERVLLNPILVLFVSVGFLVASSLVNVSTQLAEAQVGSGSVSGKLDENDPGTEGGGLRAINDNFFTFFPVGSMIGNVLIQNPFVDAGESGSTGIAARRIRGGALVRGLSAGEGLAFPLGVWASYQRSDLEDDFRGTAFDGDTDMAFLGMDISPSEDIVVGVAFGYESSDLDTTFNRGEQEIEGFTISPYFGALLSEKLGLSYDLSVDVAGGYSSVDIDQFRTCTAGPCVAVMGAGARVTSSTDAERLFISGNVNAGQSYGNWNLTGHAGLLFATTDVDGFTESDATVIGERSTDLGRFTVGGDASYSWGAFEPFLSIAYENDFTREDIVTTGVQPANDADDAVFGLGVNWYSNGGATASFRYETILGREDFNANSYNVLFLWEF